MTTKPKSLVDIRLHSHLLAQHPYTQTSEIVKHYGCIQAQDTSQAMRVIGSRLPPKTCAQNIKDACKTGKIIRTRPMRGTLHYIAPEYTHRMLDLCASKTLASFTKRRDYLGITESQANKALHIIDDALRWWKVLTRTQISNTLSDAGIPIKTQWTYHLTCYAATRKLTCFWPPTDKEETFVLLDDRIPSPPKLNTDEQLATLASMYYRSHGPATLDDFARWTGLSKTLCKQATLLISKELESQDYRGKTYYHKPIPTTEKDKTIKLLGWFDEYFLGYKDRSIVANTQHYNQLFTKNGIFFPLIMQEGNIIGTRKRSRKKTSKKSELSISTSILPEYNIDPQWLRQQYLDYANFRWANSIITP